MCGPSTFLLPFARRSGGDHIRDLTYNAWGELLARTWCTPTLCTLH